MDEISCGSLCTGTGALDAAISSLTGARLAWTAETDPAASRVIAARLPGVPNHGSIREAPWHQFEGVDVLCGGIPCQPSSVLGPMRGISDDRWLWPEVAKGIRRLPVQPALVVIENVTGLLSVSGGQAMKLILQDLDVLGYTTAHCTYAASDAGAAHARKRLFIVAARPRARDILLSALRTGESLAEEVAALPPVTGMSLLPTPVARDDGKTPEAHMAMKRRMPGGPRNTITSLGVLARNGMRQPGDEDGHRYDAAIARCEKAWGVPAPCPVESYGGGTRLAPRFAEWMMGLEPGWVTGVSGISRQEHLRIIGNGVVRRQAQFAFMALACWLLDEMEQEPAA